MPVRPATHLDAAVSAQAASCAAQTPAEQRTSAALIVDAVALAGRSTERGVLLSPARFRALRYLKGRGPTLIRVRTAVRAVQGGFRYAEDGITPRRAQRWRLYGRRLRDGTVGVGICSGSRRLLARQQLCPTQQAQPLPADGLAGAVFAALRQSRRVYRSRSVRITEAILASRDPYRGGYVRRNCGPRVRKRTIVVYLRFPSSLPSASLSQGVVLVSRFKGRYRIWARLH